MTSSATFGFNDLFSPCTAFHFELAKKYIAEFELDDRHLIREQFITVNTGSSLLGFGRIREQAGFSELCSLGILPGQRSKGHGQALGLKLIELAQQPLYLACIIPSFFEKLGFAICKDYPLGMREKLDYCRQSLPVPEDYIVMRL